MASIQGPAKKGSVEKKTLHDRMDRLFRISPVKVTARDGSGEKITLEHRVGRDAGVLTRFELMDKLGLEDQFADFVKEMTKKVRDEERLKEICDDKYSVLKSKMNRAVQDYRKYLEGVYGNYPGRPLLPMFAFVKVNDKDDGLFLQGLVEAETFKHVIGDPADNLAWSETVFVATKRFADMNKRAENTARSLMLLPGLNKDLRQRANALSQGKMPDKIGFTPEHK
jgi:hypothetical protein